MTSLSLSAMKFFFSNYVNRLDTVPSSLKKDPTLQRNRDVVCPKCEYNEAVFFQAEVTSKSTALKLILVCCTPDCDNKWEE